MYKLDYETVRARVDELELDKPLNEAQYIVLFNTLDQVLHDAALDFIGDFCKAPNDWYCAPQHTTKLSDRFEPHVVEGLLAGDESDD